MTLEEIWRSDRWKQVVERRKHVNTKECFYACRNTAINRYLMDLLNPPEHINFI